MKNQRRTFLVNLLHSTIFLFAIAITLSSGFFLVKAFGFSAHFSGFLEVVAKASSIGLVIEGFIVLALTLHDAVLNQSSPAMPHATPRPFPSRNQ